MGFALKLGGKLRPEHGGTYCFFNLRPASDLRIIGQEMEGRSCPSDVSDEEWACCAPQLTLLKEDAPLREHPLRELFNGLR